MTGFTVDFQWFFGLFTSSLVIVLGAIIRFQNLRIDKLGLQIEAFNVQIGGVKENFVRRIDTDKLERSVDEVRQDVKELRNEVRDMIMKMLLKLGSED